MDSCSPRTFWSDSGSPEITFGMSDFTLWIMNRQIHKVCIWSFSPTYQLKTQQHTINHFLAVSETSSCWTVKSIQPFLIWVWVWVSSANTSHTNVIKLNTGEATKTELEWRWWKRPIIRLKWSYSRPLGADASLCIGALLSDQQVILCKLCVIMYSHYLCPDTCWGSASVYVGVVCAGDGSCSARGVGREKWANRSDVCPTVCCLCCVIFPSIYSLFHHIFLPLHLNSRSKNLQLSWQEIGENLDSHRKHANFSSTWHYCGKVFGPMLLFWS